MSRWRLRLWPFRRRTIQQEASFPAIEFFAWGGHPIRAAIWLDSDGRGGTLPTITIRKKTGSGEYLHSFDPTDMMAIARCAMMVKYWDENDRPLNVRRLRRKKKKRR